MKTYSTCVMAAVLSYIPCATTIFPLSPSWKVSETLHTSTWRWEVWWNRCPLVSLSLASIGASSQTQTPYYSKLHHLKEGSNSSCSDCWAVPLCVLSVKIIYTLTSAQNLHQCNIHLTPLLDHQHQIVSILHSRYDNIVYGFITVINVVDLVFEQTPTVHSYLKVFAAEIYARFVPFSSKSTKTTLTRWSVRVTLATVAATCFRVTETHSDGNMHFWHRPSGWINVPYKDVVYWSAVTHFCLLKHQPHGRTSMQCQCHWCVSAQHRSWEIRQKWYPENVYRTHCCNNRSTSDLWLPE